MVSTWKDLAEAETFHVAYFLVLAGLANGPLRIHELAHDANGGGLCRNGGLPDI